MWLSNNMNDASDGTTSMDFRKNRTRTINSDDLIMMMDHPNEKTCDRIDNVAVPSRETVKEVNDYQRNIIRNDTTTSNAMVRRPSESTNDDFDMDERRESVVENETMKREGQRVTCLKLFVIMILVSSAIMIAVIVFLYIRESEEKQFIAKFQNDAHKVLESIGSSFDRTLGTMNAIAVILVSNAHSQQHPWPFVTLPDYGLHVSKLLPLTNGLFLSVAPIVYPSEKQQWEEYALENDFWVNESLAMQEVWDGYHGNITHEWARSASIYSNFGDIEANVRYDIPWGYSILDI